MVQGMTEIDPFLPLVGIGTRHSRIPLAGLKRPLEATPCNRRGRSLAICSRDVRWHAGGRAAAGN